MKLATWLILIRTHIQSVSLLLLQRHTETIQSNFSFFILDCLKDEKIFVGHQNLFCVIKSWFIVMSICVFCRSLPAERRLWSSSREAAWPTSLRRLHPCEGGRVFLWKLVTHKKSNKPKELCETWISCWSDLQSGLKKIHITIYSSSSTLLHSVSHRLRI